MLEPLHDERGFDIRNEYARTRDLFLRGFLDKSQAQAESDSFRFRTSSPQWAVRFELVQAESLVSSGQFEPGQLILGNIEPSLAVPSEKVEALSFRAIAFARLHRYPEAERTISGAERICSLSELPSCGQVPRSQGVIADEQGDFVLAQRFFHQSLDFARTHHDPWMQASALSNLGATSLELEHYDQAADWSKAAYQAATGLGAADLAERSLGNLGWAFFGLGDSERALDSFRDAEQRAAELGDLRFQLKWLTTSGDVYRDQDDVDRAREAFRESLVLARRLKSKEDIINALEDLAHTSIDVGRIDDAENCIRELEPLVKGNGNRLDAMDIRFAQARIRANQNRWPEAEDLYRDVVQDPASQTSMRIGAEHGLAQIYEAQGKTLLADRMYRAALTRFESAREQIKNEDSKLPYLSNVTDVYDDYLHFLVGLGRGDQALRIADQSRALTLAQGLGVLSKTRSIDDTHLRPTEIARRSASILLFYWLGKKQSYLWATTPQKTALFPLPPRREIGLSIERYRKALVGLGDPVENSDPNGAALYRMLVAPASQLIPAGSNIVVLSDGNLSQLNLETLIVPGPRAHYWIEDAAIVVAPSLHLLASAGSVAMTGRKLLLLGDAIAPNPDYPALRMAAVEMSEIEGHMAPADTTVFAREKATAAAYIESRPQQFDYIHFVAHGVASRTDPLDSAIILSRASDAEDSFKLHAREIIQHPIHARLVTVSACYGSGARAYAGEGLVGLAWAFLRAGAHNVIGALWEVSDESTPQLMGDLYEGVAKGLSPGAALRRAKLELLYSGKVFRKPFYWAPLQIYTGLSSPK